MAQKPIYPLSPDKVTNADRVAQIRLRAESNLQDQFFIGLLDERPNLTDAIVVAVLEAYDEEVNKE